MKKGVLSSLLCASLLCFCLSRLYSVEIIKKGKIELAQEKDFYLGFPRGFIVTEDEFIVVCDSKTADFKIYNFKGDAIKIFGRKGYGPDEFSSPWLHDYSNHKMLISDSRTEKLFIYEAQNANYWIKKNEINAVSVVDAKLMAELDRILLCRFPFPDRSSGKFYIMQTKTISTNNDDFLLAFENQFGPNSKPVDFNKMRKLSPSQMPDFMALPHWKYCDFHQNNLYFVWTGNLQIIKINLDNRKVDYFGRKTDNYIQPKVTSEFKQSYLERETRRYRNFIQKMSWVSKVFADTIYVGVIYSNFDENISRWKTFVQLYEHNGRFIKECNLSDYTSTYERGEFFFDKGKRVLFCLSDDVRDGEVTFSIQAYALIE